MRWFFLVLGLFIVMLAIAMGPRGEKFSEPPFELFPDMDHQYKVRFQKPSHFFANDQGDRKPVEGTVPMGYLPPLSKKGGVIETDIDYGRGDDYKSTGQFGDYFGSGYPEGLQINAELIERGKQRFQINCTPCHGESGNGQGIVSKYWLIPPTANLMDPRVAALPEGQIFWTITHGKGLMGPYNGTISVNDRWAIVAYVKALQDAAGL